MISNILFFSFIIVGVSIIGLIIDKLIKQICILFNIKTKKKTRNKGKSIKAKKSKTKKSISKKTRVKKANSNTNKTETKKISKGKPKVNKRTKK